MVVLGSESLQKYEAECSIWLSRVSQCRYEGRKHSPLTENARVCRGVSREDEYSYDAVKRHVGSHDGLGRRQLKWSR